MALPLSTSEHDALVARLEVIRQSNVNLVAGLFRLSEIARAHAYEDLAQLYEELAGLHRQAVERVDAFLEVL